MLAYFNSKQYEVPVVVAERAPTFDTELYWVQSEQLTEWCKELFGSAPRSAVVAYPHAGDSFITVFSEDGPIHKVWGFLSQSERGL